MGIGQLSAVHSFYFTEHKLHKNNMKNKRTKSVPGEWHSLPIQTQTQNTKQKTQSKWVMQIMSTFSEFHWPYLVKFTRGITRWWPSRCADLTRGRCHALDVRRL